VGIFLAHVVCTLFVIKIQISLIFRRTSKVTSFNCNADYLLPPVLQMSTNVIREPITAARTQFATTLWVHSAALAKLDLQEMVPFAPVSFDVI